MATRHVFDERKSEPGTGDPLPLRPSDSIELLEDPALFVRRNTEPAIGHADARTVAVPARLKVDAPALPGVLHGVAQEIHNRLLHRISVGLHRRKPVVN